MVPPWRPVRVFISSTFDDMHAERDYLVKRVFPEVREWCDRRRLLLFDVDLRWGVSQDVAAAPGGVLQACRRGVEQCDVFVCFLGQQYGSRVTEFSGIPGEAPQPVTSPTRSITEMEVDQARSLAKPRLFYLRDERFLDTIPANCPARPSVLVDCTPADQQALATFRAGITSPKEGHGGSEKYRRYSARWDPTARTPELASPQAMPEENEHRTAGRLTDFTVGGTPLATVLIKDLERVVAALLPDYVEQEQLDDLQVELDQQEICLIRALQGVVLHSGDLQLLHEYVNGDSRQLCVVRGESGLGKTTLLASWVDAVRQRRAEWDSVHVRFVGQSDGSNTVAGLLHYLLRELDLVGKVSDPLGKEDADREASRATPVTVPRELGAVERLWSECLPGLGRKGRTVILIDGLEGLQTGLDDLYWLPLNGLPPNVKIIVSIREGMPTSHAVLTRWAENPHVRTVRVSPLADPEDRRRVVRDFLQQYLKQLDPAQIEELVASAGAHNPLFLKVVLSELRVFGSWRQLTARVKTGFGTSPVSAFAALLGRLEEDPADLTLEARQAVPMMFASLIHARHGLLARDIAALFRRHLAVPAHNGGQEQAALDAAQLLLRQMEPFLSRRSGGYAPRFDSLTEAVQERYVATPERGRPLARSASSWHGLLADYFAPLLFQDVRALQELPFQYSAAGAWDKLEALLTDLRFIEEKVEAGLPGDLVNDYRTALERMPRTPADTDDPDSAAQTQRYLSSLTVMVGDPARVPAAPPAAEPWAQERRAAEIKRVLTEPTPREQMAVLESCVRSLSALTRFTGIPGFCEQQVRNATNSKVVPGLSAPETVHPHFLTVSIAPTPADPFPAVAQLLTGHASAVRSVSVTPDGRRACSVADDGTLRIWDMVSGRCLHSLTARAHSCLVMDVTGRLAVTGGEGFQLWDVEDGWLKRDVEVPGARITCAAASVDLRTVAFGCGSYWGGADTGAAEGLAVWDLVTGTPTQSLPAGRVLCVAMTPNARIAVVGVGGRLQVWDLVSCSCQEYDLESLGQQITSVAVTPDGAVIVAGGGWGAVAVLNLREGQSFPLAGHQEGEPITGVRVTADGHLAVTTSEDASLIVWDLRTRTGVRRMTGSGSALTAVDLTPDGRWAVSGSGGIWAEHEDRSLRRWDIQRGGGRPVEAVRDGRGQQCRTVSTSPDGSTLITVREDVEGVEIWQLADGRHVTSRADGHPRGARFSSDGRQYLEWSKTNLRGECVTVRESRTNRKVGRYRPRFEKVVTDAALTADNGCVVVAGQSIQAGSVHTGQPFWVSQASVAQSVAVSGDGRVAAFGFIGGRVRAFDVPSGDCLATFEGHETGVGRVDISPDARLIASPGWEGTVRVWHLESRRCLSTFGEGMSTVQSVRFTPDGQYLLAGDWEGILRLWNLQSRALVAVCPTGGVIDEITRVGPEGDLVVAGSGGLFQRLRLVNAGHPERVTATRIWRYPRSRLTIRLGSPGKWDDDLTALCPSCQRRQPVPDAVLLATRDIVGRGPADDDASSCVDVPDEAWNHPGLAAHCPGCDSPMLFNPFVLDLALFPGRGRRR